MSQLLFKILMDFYSKANKVLHLIHFFQLFNPICPKWFSLHTDEFEQPGRAEATHRSNDSSYLHTRVSIDHYFPNEQVYFPGNESPVYGGCSLELTICKSSPRCQGWWSKIQFSITTMISSHPPFFFFLSSWSCFMKSAFLLKSKRFSECTLLKNFV